MTKNEIFETALNNIKSNHLQAKLKSKNFLNSCCEQNREILNLRNKFGDLKIQIAKAELNNKESLLLQQQQKQIKKDILNILQKENKDISNLFPDYNCKLCKDTGFVNDYVCECLNNEYYKLLLENSGTDLSPYPVLNKIDFSFYNSNEEIKEKAILMSNLLKISNSKFNTILFAGETGTGKTFIAKSFLKTLILENKLGKYFSSSQVNIKFKDSYFNIEASDKILKELYDAEVLIIDDFGIEPINKNITIENYLNLLNHRQSLNKITLITTNLTLNSIKEKYTERILSRILDKEKSYKYIFKGKDLRV